jgi:excinuclease ABC subunit B
VAEIAAGGYSAQDIEQLVRELEEEMKAAAAALDFEAAARIRDQLFELRARSEGRTIRSRGALAGVKAAR